MRTAIGPLGPRTLFDGQVSPSAKRVGLTAAIAGPHQGLVDIASASVLLGCSERFVRRLVQERRIPFVKLAGTRVRFQINDLDRWVAGQRVEAKR